MTEPVTLTCPDGGHEFPVHVAYGDPDGRRVHRVPSRDGARHLDEPGPSTLTDVWEYHDQEGPS